MIAERFLTQRRKGAKRPSETRQRFAPLREKTSLKIVADGFALSPTAALHYQVANGDNDYEYGYDGHPVKSH